MYLILSTSVYKSGKSFKLVCPDQTTPAGMIVGRDSTLEALEFPGFGSPRCFCLSLDHVLVVQNVPNRVLVRHAAPLFRDSRPGTIDKDRFTTGPLGIVLDCLVQIVLGCVLGRFEQEIVAQAV